MKLEKTKAKKKELDEHNADTISFDLNHQMCKISMEVRDIFTLVFAVFQ